MSPLAVRTHHQLPARWRALGCGGIEAHASPGFESTCKTSAPTPGRDTPELSRSTMCRLLCMPNSTTVRVDVDTRDAVKAIAEADGVTLDVAIRRLVRAERQRRMGAALAEADADSAWLDVVASELGSDEGR
jgi:hypothetical protein